jgi:hypothetical protein
LTQAKKEKKKRKRKKEIRKGNERQTALSRVFGFNTQDWKERSGEELFLQ